MTTTAVVTRLVSETIFDFVGTVTAGVQQGATVEGLVVLANANPLACLSSAGASTVQGTGTLTFLL